MLRKQLQTLVLIQISPVLTLNECVASRYVHQSEKEWEGQQEIMETHGNPIQQL